MTSWKTRKIEEKAVIENLGDTVIISDCVLEQKVVVSNGLQPFLLSSPSNAEPLKTGLSASPSNHRFYLLRMLKRERLIGKDQLHTMGPAQDRRGNLSLKSLSIRWWQGGTDKMAGGLHLRRHSWETSTKGLLPKTRLSAHSHQHKKHTGYNLLLTNIILCVLLYTDYVGTTHKYTKQWC